MQALVGVLTVAKMLTGGSEPAGLEGALKAALVERRVRGVQAAEEGRGSRITRYACWAVFAGLAMIEAWSGRQFTLADGITYLDMSDALVRHNWHLLVNPLWSPLYPLLIGTAAWLVRPSAQWELPVVHGVNLIIFLGALASFEFLLREVLRISWRQDSDSVELLPAWRGQLLGYGLFAWSAFVLISVRSVTPDLLVATFVYLDAGLLLRLRTGRKRTRTCLLLGVTLGLGYLAKAILFPMAFVFLAVAFFVIGRWRKAILPLSLTLVLFSALSAPLFIGISRMAGRPSFSEAGSLNYAWHVNGEPTQPFPGPPAYLKHPMAILHRGPEVFSFKDPLISTYPPSFDAQYWNAGVRTTFSPQLQLRTIGSNLGTFREAPLGTVWILIAGGLMILWMGRNVPGRFRRLANGWFLIIPGVVGISSFLSVWVEPRYLAPFLVLVLLGFFPLILVQERNVSSKPSGIGMVAVGVAVIGLSAIFVVHRAMLPVLRDYGGEHYQAAKYLNRVGMRPGAAVGIIGSGGDGMIWARLARVQIVAQIPTEEAGDFWRISDPRAKAEVYEAFAKTGAEAIVTEQTPPPSGFAEWHRVGATRYYVHFLALSKGN